MIFNHPIGDQHVHPDFSIDAKGSLREFVKKGIELGLSEIIFTTHADGNPAFADYNFIIIDGQKNPVNHDSLKRYRDAVYDLIEGDDPVHLPIRCGVEIDYYPEIDPKFLKMIEELNFDYVLGGVHFIDEHILTVEDSVRAALEKYSPVELIDKYYGIVERAAEVHIFDCLAHLDLYRRLGTKLFPEEAARIDYESHDRALEALVEHNMPIEVNTAGIRHGIGDWYPSKPLLHKARQAGVIINGLGSDAHAPDQLATDFEMAHLIVHESFPQLYED